MIVLIVLGLIPLVYSDMDPTKVCAPDQVSFYGYNIQTDEISLISIDYKQKIMAVITGNVTVVNDLTAGKTYITDETGSCSSSNMPDPNGYPQCLPANAEYLGDIAIGVGNAPLMASVWRFPYANGHVKLAWSNEPNSPNFPILTRYSDDKGVLSASFYADVVTNITQPGILQIPDPCPPKVIV